VIGRDEVEIGLGDLDVITEIIREPDLQAADAGALLLAALEIGEPGLVAARELTQLVEPRVEAGTDVISFGEIVRELVGERAGEEITERGEFCELIANGGQLRVVTKGEQRCSNLWKLLNRVANPA